MKRRKISLLKKVLLITLCPFILYAVVIQITNLVLTRRNSDQVIHQFQNSLEQIANNISQDYLTMSENAAADLLHEIRLAAGGSLMPGESAKFANLARKQNELAQIKEFSFYRGDGQLEISSNPNPILQTISSEILDEAKTTRKMVIRGMKPEDNSLQFYLPLFADADMIRLRPDWHIGDLYGVLYTEFSKDRINQSIAAQNQSSESALAECRRLGETSLKHLQGIGLLIILGIIAFVGFFTLVAVSRTVVNPIRRATEVLDTVAKEIDMASTQMSSASQSLAGGTSQQASGLEETSSSLEEIAAMSKTNAENSEQANALARDARKAAEEGDAAMEQMTQAINAIRTSANETAKIIHVIDEIAFQTNLLALNAAVEAARAGEAGKGFAVVAQEVRTLAQRSAQAARDTAELIEQSVTNVKNGVDITTNVSQMLKDITDANRKVNSLIDEITAASHEQAQGVDQVNQAMDQMEKITQKNAANAEESAGIAEELNTQSSKMKTMVGNIVGLIGGSKTKSSGKSQ
ncbi:MAG: methyl-accepting chemotaxis protein [Sedimentisphaerales bacterium]|nr:methyl-accepting chemotaxis protein [Sedimentisphaerales bacterium]